MSNFIADKSYIAVKPQSAAGTPVIPNHFIPLVSESLRVNPNLAADRRMKGLDWKSDGLVKGARTVEGDVVLWGDPDTIGHVLNMAYAKGSTTGDADNGYTHPFTPGDGKSYSIEIPRGTFAQRFYGMRADSVKFDFQDNKLMATVSLKGLGQFYTASLAVALTGAGMTSAVLSTDSDLRPADGLVAGDVLVFGSTEVTLTSINADGKTVGFGSTSVTASVGDPVFLKAQTPSFGTVAEPLYFGNTNVGIGADSTAADTAAGAKATSTPCYNFSTEIKNNVLAAPASGSTGASAILNQVKEAAFELSRLFETPAQYQKWIEGVKQAFTVITTGRFIKADLSTSEKLTIKYHKANLATHEEPLVVGQYIFDKQKFEANYDTSDAKAIEITVVNRTADTAY